MEAINHARMRYDAHERCSGLLTIFNTLRTLGTTSLPLLEEIHSLGIEHQNNERWLSLLGEIALASTGISDNCAAQIFDHIISIAEKIENDAIRVGRLASIAVSLIRAGNDLGPKVLDKVYSFVLDNEEAIDEDTFHDVAVNLAEAHRFDDAITLSNEI